MSKGPLHSSTKSDIQYWSRKEFGKNYEYLTDEQAQRCWELLSEFLLQWQEEMERIRKGE